MTQWNKVESSTIAAIGYDPDILTLGVRYLSGDIYLFHNIQPLMYARLMSAPSKGKWLHAALNAKGMKVEFGKEVREETVPSTGAAADPVAPEILNVLDPEASPCCKTSFLCVVRSVRFTGCNSFECPQCGTKFMVDPDVTDVRYWRIRATFAVHRRP